MPFPALAVVLRFGQLHLPKAPGALVGRELEAFGQRQQLAAIVDAGPGMHALATVQLLLRQQIAQPARGAVVFQPAELQCAVLVILFQLQDVGLVGAASAKWRLLLQYRAEMQA